MKSICKMIDPFQETANPNHRSLRVPKSRSMWPISVIIDTEYRTCNMFVVNGIRNNGFLTCYMVLIS